MFIILYAGCDYNYLAISKTYSLRDIGPAGGWIFYINPNYKSDGWKYLEAAPSDQSTTTAWITGGTAWQTNNGNTSVSIGTGLSNSNAIVSQTGHTGSAAKLCLDYSVNGYSDWFLPSKDELNQMYENLYPFNVGSFRSDYYWSSSEETFDHGWAINFSPKTVVGLIKNTATVNTRAIRAF
jgi:hypothetical protein